MLTSYSCGGGGIIIEVVVGRAAIIGSGSLPSLNYYHKLSAHMNKKVSGTM